MALIPGVMFLSGAEIYLFTGRPAECPTYSTSGLFPGSKAASVCS